VNAIRKIYVAALFDASTFMYVDYQQQLYDCQELLTALSMHDFPFETKFIAALCLVLHYSCLNHKSGKPMCLLLPDASICITFLLTSKSA
jgi:hypothetical protein